MRKVTDGNGKLLDCGYTSPLGVRILIHYSYTDEDFKDSPASQKLINQFVGMGLLKVNNGDGKNKYIGNTKALSLYVQKLTRIPLPKEKMKWVIEHDEDLTD